MSKRSIGPCSFGVSMQLLHLFELLVKSSTPAHCSSNSCEKTTNFECFLPITNLHISGQTMNFRYIPSGVLQQCVTTGEACQMKTKPSEVKLSPYIVNILSKPPKYFQTFTKTFHCGVSNFTISVSCSGLARQFHSPENICLEKSDF